jgi:hypothetical protein
MEGYYHATYHHHPRTIYVMHQDKYKARLKVHSIGTICTGACLAQRKKLASVMLHEIVPQASLQQPPSLTENHLRRWAYTR